MEINTIIEVVKRWVEDETGPGFGYHISHCDDLSSYYNVLKEMLENAEKGETISGTAWNVDGSLVIETDQDWPNELRDLDSAKVELDINFLEYLDNTDEGE